GELDVDGEEAVDAVLRPLAARYDGSQVVFDCQALTFMDVAGLRALIKAVRRFAGQERVTLSGVQEPVLRLLEATNARHLFQVVERTGEPSAW
ncbi:MAG: hypothetical protein JWO68_2952, partial [Actinomycetia bacterium]|nr:hypothetical protein [Actinomycetes bacterium]